LHFLAFTAGITGWYRAASPGSTTLLTASARAAPCNAGSASSIDDFNNYSIETGFAWVALYSIDAGSTTETGNYV